MDRSDQNLLQENNKSLLLTKMYIPATSNSFIHRPHLLHILDQSLQRKLACLCAPAGYGKTALLSQWSHTLTSQPVWISLDSRDNDSIRFWTYITTALEKCCPEIRMDLLPYLYDAQPLPIESFLMQLLNTLATGSHEYVIILDNYHLITEKSIHDALTFWLTYQPPRVHLILATRMPLPLSLARIRAQNQLIEIDASELSFNLQEAQKFLAQSLSTPVSTKTTAQLIQKAEGWITGLQLGVLALKENKEGSSINKISVGDHRYFVEYLTEEVLLYQSEETKTFLLYTSVLDRFTVSLYNAVTNRDDGQKMLLALKNANFFLVSLDATQQWYCYNSLFSEALRALFQQQYAESITDIQLRASFWYENHDLLREAIEYALAASHFERAALLINKVVEALVMEHGESQTLLQWIDALPAPVINSHPRLQIFHALALLLSQKVESAAIYLQEAENQLREQPLQPTDLQGELATIHALIYNTQGDFPKALTYCSQALAELSAESLKWRIAIKQVQSLALLLLGEVEAARQMFIEILEESRSRGHLYMIIATYTSIAEVLKDQGKLVQAADHYQQALQLVGSSQESLYALITSSAALGLGSLYYEWDELDKAESYLLQGIEQSKHRDVTGILPLLGYIYLAFIKLAQQKPDGALSFLEQAERSIQSEIQPQLTSDLQALRAQVYLAQGQFQKALHWAQRFRVREQAVHRDDPIQKNLEFQRTILAYIFISTGNPAGALDVLARLHYAVDNPINEKRVIEILVIQALALYAQRDVTQAIGILKQAFSRAQQGGYIRAIVDKATPHLTELLTLLQHAPITTSDNAHSYQKMLLQILSRQSGQQENTTLQIAPPGTNPHLSMREHEVLRYIALGYSTQAIAETLILSQNTVKTHIKRLFVKLEVNNRLEAVAKAKKLHFI